MKATRTTSGVAARWSLAFCIVLTAYMGIDSQALAANSKKKKPCEAATQKPIQFAINDKAHVEGLPGIEVTIGGETELLASPHALEAFLMSSPRAKLLPMLQFLQGKGLLFDRKGVAFTPEGWNMRLDRLLGQSSGPTEIHESFGIDMPAIFGAFTVAFDKDWVPQQLPVFPARLSLVGKRNTRKALRWSRRWNDELGVQSPSEKAISDAAAHDSVGVADDDYIDPEFEEDGTLMEPERINIVVPAIKVSGKLWDIQSIELDQKAGMIRIGFNRDQIFEPKNITDIKSETDSTLLRLIILGRAHGILGTPAPASLDAAVKFLDDMRLYRTRYGDSWVEKFTQDYPSSSVFEIELSGLKDWGESFLGLKSSGQIRVTVDLRDTSIRTSKDPAVLEITR